MIQRGEVFQLGRAKPNATVEDQPGLVYGIGNGDVIDERGRRVDATDPLGWCYRGTIAERDLRLIER